MPDITSANQKNIVQKAASKSTMMMDATIHGGTSSSDPVETLAASARFADFVATSADCYFFRMSPTSARNSFQHRSFFERLCHVSFLAAALFSSSSLTTTVAAFTVLPCTTSSPPRKRPPRVLQEFEMSRRTRLQVTASASANTTEQMRSSDVVAYTPEKDHDEEEDLLEDDDDDDALLEAVTSDELADLCGQLRLSPVGTKAQLLQRLRHHAHEQIQLEKRRLADRIRRVEAGDNGGTGEEDMDAPQHSKERHEIVGESFGPSVDDDEDDEDDDVVFYFPLPTPPQRQQPTVPSQTSSATPKVKARPLTRAALTAPPPPEHPNENGERVVTVYASADHNDLTGVAAAQPGQSSSLLDSLGAVASAGSSPGVEPWEQSQQGDLSAQEVERATEAVTELVQCLLAMSGAPAFVAMGVGDDDDDEEDEAEVELAFRSLPRPSEFVGFQPAKVPSALLTASSKALRTRRGQVLQDVLRKVELQAIGHDGLAGDNADRGGGHYREVAKVRAFLEGYRRAEVRRLARETAALLLDKLVLEGVEGLDTALASMTRSGDEASDHAGELNDSLLSYLGDAIRQQEQKVATEQAATRSRTPLPTQASGDLPEAPDALASLWTVESEDGSRVESIDPNNPKVKQALLDEYSQSEVDGTRDPHEGPKSPSEQLLWLLKLLRQRMEAEAAFSPDEKGRNLRLLAYALRVTGRDECEQLILKETGSALDVSVVCLFAGLVVAYVIGASPHGLTASSFRTLSSLSVAH